MGAYQEDQSGKRECVAAAHSCVDQTNDGVQPGTYSGNPELGDQSFHIPNNGHPDFVAVVGDVADAASHLVGAIGHVDSQWDHICTGKRWVCRDQGELDLGFHAEHICGIDQGLQVRCVK